MTRNGKCHRLMTEQNLYIAFLYFCLLSSAVLTVECSCGCDCSTDESSDSCCDASSASCCSTSSSSEDEECPCTVAKCIPPSNSTALLIAANSCEYSNQLEFIGSCNCTPSINKFQLFHLFYDSSLIEGRQYITTSVVISCRNVSMFCARGEDNQFYTALNTQQRTLAFLHFHCNNNTNACGQKQCDSFLSFVGFGPTLGSSFSAPLIAQNGSVLNTTDLVDLTLPTSGLLSVNAVSCYGCEVIKSAEIEKCQGNFEKI